MTIEFEFVQDYRVYRNFVTYITNVEQAMNKLPLEFYQGDMQNCYVVQKNGNVVTVTLTSKAQDLVERFIEEAQPDTFEPITDGIPFMYNLATHELIYDFDTKEPSTTWDWATYPDTYWVSEEARYDNGLCMDRDKNLCRVYLSNKPLIALLVSINEVNNSFPKVAKRDELKYVGTGVVLDIIASNLSQPLARAKEVGEAISNALIDEQGSMLDYKTTALADLFLDSLSGEADDWEEVWGAGVTKAIDLDNLADEWKSTQTGHGTTGIYTNQYGQRQLNLSDLAELSEVPQVDYITFVHLDIPINGISYMMIVPEQTLQIWYDDRFITREVIKQMVDGLPDEQIDWFPEIEHRATDDGVDYDSFQSNFDDLNDDDDLSLAGGIH